MTLRDKIEQLKNRAGSVSSSSTPHKKNGSSRPREHRRPNQSRSEQQDQSSEQYPSAASYASTHGNTRSGRPNIPNPFNPLVRISNRWFNRVMGELFQKGDLLGKKLNMLPIAPRATIFGIQLVWVLGVAYFLF